MTPKLKAMCQNPALDSATVNGFEKAKATKTVFGIRTAILLAVLASTMPGFSQVVTNYLSPKPTWRYIENKIYDLKTLPSVKVPQDLTYHIIGYKGVPREPITLAGFGNKRPPLFLTFKNYPYDPKDFSLGQGFYGLRPKRLLYCRAMMTEVLTNWNMVGQAVSVNLTYDCGSPVTNAVPINAQQ